MSKKTDNSNKIHEAREFYVSFLNYTKSVFTSITDTGVLNLDSIAEKIKKLWNEVLYNRRFLLYSRNCIEPVHKENYIASHSVRTTVWAMILGKYFNLPNHRLIELGISALLHDIGMLKLPTETYLKGLDLSAQDKILLKAHPVYSYTMLKSLKCPPAISLAVLDHHERENGSGYPRGLKSENINSLGKIIAVACSYEAITSNRLYKKAKDNHTGIVELLKNEDKKYDAKIIKALVVSLSVYPIGMFVLLSDGRRGQVFDINPSNHHYPIVRLFEQKDKKETIIFTDRNNVSIVRPLAYEEISIEELVYEETKAG